jgi:hypothetical protein
MRFTGVNFYQVHLIRAARINNVLDGISPASILTECSWLLIPFTAVEDEGHFRRQRLPG